MLLVPITNSKYTRNNCIKCTFKVSTLPMCNVHNVWQIKADGIKDNNNNIKWTHKKWNKTNIRRSCNIVCASLPNMKTRIGMAILWKEFCYKIPSVWSPLMRQLKCTQPMLSDGFSLNFRHEIIFLIRQFNSEKCIQ